MAKTKKVEPEVVESLTGDLIKTLNTKFKGTSEKSAFYLNDSEVTSEVKGWVPSGNDILDIVMSNRPHGGYPIGRIVEVSGLEGCVHPNTLIKVRIYD